MRIVRFLLYIIKFNIKYENNNKIANDQIWKLYF